MLILLANWFGPYVTWASLANRETLVVPCGFQSSQAASRERFIAAAVITC
jgi:hypothetical protein